MPRRFLYQQKDIGENSKILKSNKMLLDKIPLLVLGPMKTAEG
jgi:hypothetical protein